MKERRQVDRQEQMKKKKHPLKQIQASTFSALEFHDVLEFFALNASTQLAKQSILNPGEISQQDLPAHYVLLKDWIAFLEDHKPIPIPELPDSGCFSRNPHEKPLTSEEVRGFRDLMLFWMKFKETEHLLSIKDQLTQNFDTEDDELGDIVKQLKDAFTPDGNWSPNATPKLKKLSGEEQRIEKRLETLLLDKIHHHSSQLTEQVIFERNGRRVLAVNKTFKRKMPGILQDYSTSGQTAFIEPDTSTPLQNRLQEIFFEKREEIFRYRVEITQQLSEIPLLKKALIPLVTKIDRQQSMAITATQADCHPITPNSTGSLFLFNARHPLLDEKFAKHRESVTGTSDRNRMVPFTLRLDGDQNGQIISGANAGGKTVTIKTAGLLCLLANYGFPVPVDPDSDIPYYDHIFADIGDHQSLSHNLSTYASHLESMKTILNQEKARCLILLDELGSGTDPHEGNALAQALIEECLTRDVHLLVTTHQQVLCSFALNHPKLGNASMSFDKNRLVPTYHFVQGVPGRSHALEIAERIGLPETLMARARNLVEDNQMDIQQAIMKLQEQSKLLEKQKTKFKKEERRALRRIQETKAEKQNYQVLQENLKKKEKERVQKAINRVEKEFRALLKDVESRKTRQRLVGKFSQTQKELIKDEDVPAAEPVQIPSSGIAPDKWKENDPVYSKTWGKMGTIISMDKKQARVNVSGMTLTLPIKDLIHTSEESKEKSDERIHMYAEEVSFRTIPLDLKLIGKSREDALNELSSIIDAAFVQHPAMLNIIHGHGHGILKQAVRSYLETHPLRSHWELKIDQENDGNTALLFRWY